VSLPRGYEAESGRYPVVYVLDAETNFGATSYIAHRLAKNGDIPKVLVVGIAYDTTYDDFYKKRARDLTPVRTRRFEGSGGAWSASSTRPSASASRTTSCGTGRS
jgi:predicted alpha/beta superfamily hydrolase